MTLPEGSGAPQHENRIAVILVNYHSEQYLQPCLDAVARQSRRPDRLIVVDNGSDRDRLEQIVQSYPGAELLSMRDNVGFAAANNRAVETVNDCRWIALLNVDTLPDAGWLNALVQAAEQHPQCVFFGSLLTMANSPGLIDGTGDVYHCSGRHWRRDHGTGVSQMHKSTDGTIAPCAAAAMYRYDAWLAVGGFDEAFVSYDEDMDLGLRLYLSGHKYRHVPEAIVAHIGSAITGRHSKYSVYYGQRNLVWTYVKNMPGILFWKYLPQHLLLNLLAVAWFIRLGRGLTVCRAKWDAVRGLPRVWRQRRLIQKNRQVQVHDFDAQLAHGVRQLLRGS